MKALSVFVGYHDTSAAVLDGDHLTIVEYERVTGVRYDTAADAAEVTKFLVFVLATCHMNPADIDVVILVVQDGSPPGMSVDEDTGIQPMRGLTFDTPRWRYDAFAGAAYALGLREDIWYVEHHLAHAWAAGTLLDAGIVLAADGGGSHQHSALYTKDAAGLHLLTPNAFGVNWGQLYRKVPAGLITEFRGGRFELPGKIMALAGMAPADPHLSDTFIDLASSGEGDLERWIAAARDGLGLAADETLSRDDDAAWALCASLQRALESDSVRLLRRSAPADLLAAGLGVSGGVALNVTNNSVLAEVFSPRRFSVPSAPGDGGLCLGGLLAVLARLGQAAPVTDTAFLGLPPSGTSLASAWPLATPEELTERLVSGQVVAMVTGRAEVGPRALGHRSLLALPESPAMKDRLNRIKKREWFRPVAPILDERDVATLCTRDVRSPFMSQLAVWTPESAARFPSAVHADGTARLQTVSPDDPDPTPTLLRELRSGGHPVLLNTSLNGPGQSIFASLPQAVAFWHREDVDAVVVEVAGTLHILGR